MKVVILAGGFGTRISEESHLKPKPMIEIGDMPILWHIMKYYSHFGFNDFVICCGYKGYMIKEYFMNYYLHCSDVTFDFVNKNNVVIHTNAVEPWKVTVVDTGLNTMTGGRIRRIREYTENKPFLMTYGDGVGNIDLAALVKQHKESGKSVTLTAVQPIGRFGVLNINEGTLTVTAFQEKRREDNGWINAGFMVMETDVFNYLDGDNVHLEQGPMERLCEEGKLGAYQHYGYWQCMDTQRDKAALDELLGSNQAPWKVW